MLIVIAATTVVIAGLFALRAYYGDKLGIFADALTDEKVILSKDVATDGFANDQITNLERNGDVLQIKNQPKQVCGGGGDQPFTSKDSLPASATMRIKTTPAESDNGSTINSYDQNYYVDDELVNTSDRTISLIPKDVPFDISQQMLITRGYGWVEFRLMNGSSTERNAFLGSVTFSKEISLNASSLNYVIGGDGLEDAANGTTNLSGNNDEVKLESENNEVFFHLVNTDNRDTFRINYCFTESANIEGSIAGTIDLGEPKPLTSLRVKTENYLADRDNILLSSQLSNDGINWINNKQIDGRRLNYQDRSPVDNYCFQYIKFSITLQSDSASRSAFGFLGIDIYGGDTCGATIGFNPGRIKNVGSVCSNGVDDDGDGKIDFSPTGGGDSGCTGYMDGGEEDATQVCKNGTNDNINVKITIDEHKSGSGADLTNNIYLGSEPTPYVNGGVVPLFLTGR